MSRHAADAHAVLAVAAFMLSACGGQVERTSPSFDAGGGFGDDATPLVEGGAMTDASVVVPGCSNSSGDAVCGGTNECDAGAACECFINPPTSGVSVCKQSAGFSDSSCSPCADPTICIDLNPAMPGVVMFCEPSDFGPLFASNGGASRVRFSDWSAWTSTPIPAVTSCPTTNVVQLCGGGGCGACPENTVCTGRSPVHPLGWCAPSSFDRCSTTNPTCSLGMKCLTYTVDEASQSFADAHGFCVEPDICAAVASQLPGGASCS